MSLSVKELKGGFRTAFIMLSLESVFGGYYVAITRSAAPIFFVSVMGLGLKGLLTLNFIAGVTAVSISGLLYRTLKREELGVKYRLMLSMAMERLLWLLIPFSAWSPSLAIAVYAAAVASTVPTGIFLYSAFLNYYSGITFRRLIAYRTMGSSISSILGQLTLAITLAMASGIWRFILLYIVAFSVGAFSLVVVALAPLKGVRITPPKRVEEEIDMQAVNTFLMLITLLIGINLLSIAWVPRLIINLHTPDYYPALITVTQTLTAVIASLFWVRRGVNAHRIGMLVLAATPIMVYLIGNPQLHLGIAVVYSFSLVGANLYVSSAYSEVVKKLGTLKASTLLATGNSAALALGSALGLAVFGSEAWVFTASSLATLTSLAIALTAVKGMGILPERYSRLYARILYNTSIAGYNALVISAERTAKLTLVITGLLIALSVLYIIYRTVYYLIILTRGGG